jgi:hypothetical protein
MIYLFVWYPFTAISCIVIFRYLKSNLQKITGVVLLCTACFGTWYSGYAPVVESTLKPETSCTVQEISDYVVNRGYAYIYGDWSIVCPIAAHTNGKSIAACYLKKPLEILGYINPQGVYGEEENKKAVYVFFENQNLSALQYASKIGAKMTLLKEYESGYTLYISDKQLMHYGPSSLLPH